MILAALGLCTTASGRNRRRALSGVSGGKSRTTPVAFLAFLRASSLRTSPAMMGMPAVPRTAETVAGGPMVKRRSWPGGIPVDAHWGAAPLEHPEGHRHNYEEAEFSHIFSGSS